MFSVRTILNADNWCALGLPILHKQPITVEQSFYALLKPPEAGRYIVKSKDRMEEIKRMRAAGAKWKDVAIELGFASENCAASYYSHRLHNNNGHKRRIKA